MRLKIVSFALALFLLVGFTGCAVFSRTDADPVENAEDSVSQDEEYPVELNGVLVESRPGIIVSLSPAITEKLGDLGLQSRLEGISDYCDAPEGFERARVGTVLLPDMDEITRISPHLVLTEAELTEAQSSAIAAMGAQIVLLPRAESIEGVLDNYKALAILLEGNRSGGDLSEAFEKRFMQKYDNIVNNGLAESKNAIYLRALDFYIATGDTLEGSLMEQIGFYNIAEEYTEWVYPKEDAESGDGRKSFVSIDFIFCDKRSVTIKMLENSSFYKGLDAVLKDRYLYIDSSAFERQTMRMLDELDRMRLYGRGEIPGSKDEQLESASEAA